MRIRGGLGIGRRASIEFVRERVLRCRKLLYLRSVMKNLRGGRLVKVEGLTRLLVLRSDTIGCEGIVDRR